MGRWTFVRHGQSVANRDGWFAGHIDAPLTARGRAEAETARTVLADRQFGRAYCSDLSRASVTAQIIVSPRNIPVTVSASLRERHCGHWEGRSIAEVERIGGMDILRSFDRAPELGESLRTVAQRVLQFMLVHNGQDDVLLVGHGGLMRAVIGVIDGIASAEIGLWRPKNCEIVDRSLDNQMLAAALELVAPRG